MAHIGAFLKFIPSVNDLSQLHKQQPTQTILPKSSSDDAAEEQVAPSISSPANTTPKLDKPKIPVSAVELDLPTEKVPKEILLDIFEKAEMILADKNGITTAASADPRMRTVKSATSALPHIITPSSKNIDLQECKCKTHAWYLICEHTISVAVNLSMCFAYFVQVKKKIAQSKTRRGLTAESQIFQFPKLDNKKRSNMKPSCQEAVKSERIRSQTVPRRKCFSSKVLAVDHCNSHRSADGYSAYIQQQHVPERLTGR